MKKSVRKTAAGNSVAEKMVDLHITKPAWDYVVRTTKADGITIEDYIRRLIRRDIESAKDEPVKIDGCDVVFQGKEGKKLVARMARVAKAQGVTIQQVFFDAMEERMRHPEKWKTQPVTVDRETWRRAKVLADKEGISLDALHGKLIEREYLRLFGKGKKGGVK